MDLPVCASTRGMGGAGLTGGVDPLLPMYVLYQSLGQVSTHGAHNLISPPSARHSSV
jgi:hypothetical protein